MRSHFLLSLIACLMIAACSGGGGDSSSPQNPTLAFSRTGSATVDEKSTTVTYTLDVSAFNAAQLSYRLAGGADQGLFDIVAGSGALTFTVAPDFEQPADANGDNVYEVIIEAGDAASFGRLTLSVTVSNVIEGFQIIRIATGFNQPLFAAAFTDGSNRLYVLEKGGDIEILDLDSGLTATTKFLSIGNDISTAGEGGLLGFALHPDFASNGQFFVNVTNLDGDTEIRRYQVSAGNPDVADTMTKDVIFTVPQPATNHNGGSIEFGTDGFLYVALGDGGGGGDPFANGQDPNTTLGAILRIDVDADDFPADNLRDYGIPAGNPFASGGGAAEIFAFGLRNPYRFSVDRDTGILYIGDVGQGAHEEIDILDPATDAGANFGWNVREGVAPFNGGTDSPSFTGPVADYSHASGFGRSVTGGYVYRGGSDELRGKYIFGDFISGRIFAIPADGLDPATPILQDAFEELTADFTPDFGTIDNVSSFALDADDNLYVIDFGGEVFQVRVD